AEEHEGEGRARGRGSDELVGAEQGLQAREQKGATDGTDSDRAEEQAVELGPRRDLVPGDEREQGPVGAGEEKEAGRPNERCHQVPIVPDVAPANAEGGTKALRWQRRPGAGCGTPPPQNADDRERTQ